jgi:DNA-binding Lrp family transcriptional regulator
LQLDDTDKRIIAELAADARTSFAEIGLQVSLSAPAVKRRVDRLRSAGVIRGFTAVVDPAAIGWTTEAFIELFCTGRTTPAQIAAAVRRHPEVIGAYTVSGEADALVHLRAADIPHLEQALERLRSESFIISTKSMIVLSRLVDAATQTTGPSPTGAGSSGRSSTGAGPAGAIGDGQPGSVAPPAEP